MKEKKVDRKIQELFRQKLEAYETEPARVTGRKLMRRLEAREFVRFNPVRFNIWYLGALAVAGTLTAIFLTAVHSGPRVQPSQQSDTVFSVPSGKALLKPDEPVEAEQPQGAASPEVPQVNRSTDRVQHKPARAGDRKPGIPDVGGAVSGTLIPGSPPLLGMQARPALKTAAVRRDKLIGVSVSEGCAPLRVEFRALAGVGDSCLWSFGDGGSSVSVSPGWIYDMDGEYRVDLKIFKKDGSVRSGSELIRVFPAPQARFEIIHADPARKDGQVSFRNFSADAARYNWSFGDGSNSDEFEPVHLYQRTGTYNVSLKVISASGCVDSLTVFNASSGSAFFIEFPNAFIPNPGGPSGGSYSTVSDETAQVFHPSFNGVAEYRLRIFSRLGVLLFETNDINTGWDGYFKGQLCDPGVYVWKVRGSFSNGEPFTRMGDVTLIGK